MAASYPSGFDTMSDPSSNLSGPPLHSTMHNQINDVLEAIEAELGLNPSGADATVAVLLARLPQGKMARAATTASQTTITTVTDLTSATVTFTALAGRRYKITGSCLVVGATATVSAALSIRKGASTQIQAVVSTLLAIGDIVTLVAVVDDVPGAGSVTYKLSLARQGGTGTLGTSFDATRPDLILVEDIGT